MSDHAGTVTPNERQPDARSAVPGTRVDLFGVLRFEHDAVGFGMPWFGIGDSDVSNVVRVGRGTFRIFVGVVAAAIVLLIAYIAWWPSRPTDPHPIVFRIPAQNVTLLSLAPVLPFDQVATDQRSCPDSCQPRPGSDPNEAIRAHSAAMSEALSSIETAIAANVPAGVDVAANLVAIDATLKEIRDRLPRTTGCEPRVVRAQPPKFWTDAAAIARGKKLREGATSWRPLFSSEIPFGQNSAVISELGKVRMGLAIQALRPGAGVILVTGEDPVSEHGGLAAKRALQVWKDFPQTAALVSVDRFRRVTDNPDPVKQTVLLEVVQPCQAP